MTNVIVKKENFRAVSSLEELRFVGWEPRSWIDKERINNHFFINRNSKTARQLYVDITAKDVTKVYYGLEEGFESFDVNYIKDEKAVAATVKDANKFTIVKSLDDLAACGYKLVNEEDAAKIEHALAIKEELFLNERAYKVHGIYVLDPACTSVNIQQTTAEDIEI
ncbi:hypothetical protein [Listeria booriae]|uniref:hypothetical protein n=1 Tax=Listeria booriae TaxID=1552123 RepID=UPI0016266F40|nr:hypothetical protein [Listeria booriae]MBC2188674.1 hypothetical protein [Listeria booriae]